MVILPAKTKLKLIEKSALSMIKVHLHKYELPGCTLGAIETDLQLIPVKKRSNKKTSVGVNLLKGCRLEIFVDMEEYSTISFLE